MIPWSSFAPSVAAASAPGVSAGVAGAAATGRAGRAAPPGECAGRCSAPTPAVRQMRPRIKDWDDELYLGHSISSARWEKRREAPPAPSSGEQDKEPGQGRGVGAGLVRVLFRVRLLLCLYLSGSPNLRLDWGGAGGPLLLLCPALSLSGSPNLGRGGLLPSPSGSPTPRRADANRAASAWRRRSSRPRG